MAQVKKAMERLKRSFKEASNSKPSSSIARAKGGRPNSEIRRPSRLRLRVQNKCICLYHFGAVEWQEVITTIEPIAQLITVVRATRMARLTGRVNCPQPLWRRPQIGNQPVVGS